VKRGSELMNVLSAAVKQKSRRRRGEEKKGRAVCFLFLLQPSQRSALAHRGGQEGKKREKGRPRLFTLQVSARCQRRDRRGRGKKKEKKKRKKGPIPHFSILLSCAIDKKEKCLFILWFLHCEKGGGEERERGIEGLSLIGHRRKGGRKSVGGGKEVVLFFIPSALWLKEIEKKKGREPFTSSPSCGDRGVGKKKGNSLSFELLYLLGGRKKKDRRTNRISCPARNPTDREGGKKKKEERGITFPLSRLRSAPAAGRGRGEGRSGGGRGLFIISSTSTENMGEKSEGMLLLPAGMGSGGGKGRGV